jgi:hypothetical protein
VRHSKDTEKIERQTKMDRIYIDMRSSGSEKVSVSSGRKTDRKESER